MNFPIEEMTPAVSARAQGMKVKNAYITLEALERLCEGDETLEYCLQDTLICSLRYAETVCRFEQIVGSGQQSNENGMREEIERVRSSIHDTTISSINALSRQLKLKGKDYSWISKVKVAERAGYGLFAILIAFEAAQTINASTPSNL